MKTFIAILFTLIYSSGYCQNSNLFKITENNKFGFIDTSGMIIIKPIFSNTGEFSEGIAPARINGYWGYINTTGNFVIQPQFDYATSFQEEIAIVYKGIKMFLINKKGQIISELPYAVVGQFINNRAFVKTVSNKMGVINKMAKLIIDTAFKEISPFVEGIANVEGVNHNPDASKAENVNFEVGVIDTLGKFIIPFGLYRSIEKLNEGKFIARKIDKDTIGNKSTEVVLYKDGKVLLPHPLKNHEIFYGNFKNGIIRILQYRNWMPENIQNNSTDNIYIGYMNEKGEIINDNSAISDFSEDKALAKEKIKKEWNLIDSTAKYIIETELNDIDNDFFFIKKKNPVNSTYLTGFASKKGNIILEPVMQSFDKNGFCNGLLKCVIDDKSAYVNKKGEIVWQEKDNDSLTNLNSDMMYTSYFYAFSEKKKKITQAIMHNFPVNALSIIVKPDFKDTFMQKFKGYKVYIANTSYKKIYFNTEYFSLKMKVQAKDKDGEWKDIEQLEAWGFDRRKYFSFFEPNQYLSYVTPCYEGDFKTKLRIAFTYIDPSAYKEENLYNNEERLKLREITVYSNEYDGSVNPGQFWRKRDYDPAKFIDLFSRIIMRYDI